MVEKSQKNVDNYSVSYPTESCFNMPLQVESVYERIIWSADVDSQHTLFDTLNTIPHPIWVKIDRAFALEHGRSVFQSLRDRDVRIFNDAKLVEIPSKLKKLAELEVRDPCDMLNCMAGSVSNMDWSNPDLELRDGLQRFAGVCLEAGVLPCGVTVLTSKKDAIVAAEFGGRNSTDQVLWYAEALINAGFTDVVCSPLEAAAINQAFSGEIDTNTPGILLPNSSSPDQARTNTPGPAVASGCDRLVIGRALTGENAAANLAAIVADIENGA